MTLYTIKAQDVDNCEYVFGLNGLNSFDDDSDVYHDYDSYDDDESSGYDSYEDFVEAETQRMYPIYLNMTKCSMNRMTYFEYKNLLVKRGFYLINGHRRTV